MLLATLRLHTDLGYDPSEPFSSPKEKAIRELAEIRGRSNLNSLLRS